MMIDLKNIKIKIHKRKNGYLNKAKYFRCYCISCGQDRGYQTASRYKNKPMCIKCATNTEKHRDVLRENHWSKTGKYSPKIYVTKTQIKDKQIRELSYNKKYYKLYYQKNKNKIHEKRKLYEKNNINHKLSKRLRTRLNQALKNNHKSGSAVKDLGCSIKYLKKHLEAKFQPGMSWNNYGRGGWHIDHIRPLSAFNLSNKNELLRACHYSNLQPLWAADNLKKGSSN